ncbi:MAG: hypothetical protein R6V72_07920 [Cyclobacterium sp.]|nr:hypothetical protein [Cyclobacterium sp. SYSU L10401]
MSSVTILFVLDRILKDPDYINVNKKTIYAAAFGPGVSLESALIRYN